MESTWDEANKTNTWSESFSNAGRSGIEAKDIINFIKTEIFNETSGTSTMKTTGTSDHIGWMYLGETFTEIDVTETRNSNWEVESLTGTAKNSDGETVSFGWEYGQITIDGDNLTTTGTEDFNKSADNFENKWIYYDHEGTEWTVTESQQGEAWVSEEKSEYGDKRFFKTLWGFEDENGDGVYDVWNDANNNHKYDTGEGDKSFTKEVEKYSSADGDIKFKTVSKFYDNGFIMMKMKGNTDHLFDEYLGDIYSDIDVKIGYKGNGDIEYIINYDGDYSGVKGLATIKNPDGQKLEVTSDFGRQILIDGMDIHNLGDDFYKDFDQGKMAHFDNMETGTWEFDFTDHEGNQIHAVEEGKATDIVTIKTDSYVYNSITHNEGLAIIAIFDADSGDLLSVTGLPTLAEVGFNEANLQGWYKDNVIPNFPNNPSPQEEITYIQNKVDGFLTSKSVTPDSVSLDVDFNISDTRVTTETVYMGSDWVSNTGTGAITIRTRTEQLGKEIEREESYNDQSDFDTGTIASWEQTERSFTQGKFGLEMIEENTSSNGEDLTVTIISNPDGTQTMQAEGTAYFDIDTNPGTPGVQGMLASNVKVTSQMDGPRFVDFFGTGTINGQDGIVKSDGTSPYGEPLIRIILADGTEIKTYDADELKAAEMHSSGNPLNHHVLEDGDVYYTSPDWNWEQTSFNISGNQVTFEGVRQGTDQTITVVETRDYQGPFLTSIQQQVSTSRGEDYTATYTLNDRFDVEVDFIGKKHFRGELYNDVDMFKEITLDGQVMIEGTARKLDGTNVEFFKGHHDDSLEIISVDRDGNIHKLAENEDGSRGPVNEMHQWQFTDHDGKTWTVIEKFDGTNRTSTETTDDGDERTIKETWDDNGGFTHVMTEALVGESVRMETRTGTKDTTNDGKFKDVQTVVRTVGGVEVENFTETVVFNADYTSTMTITGTVEFMDVSYANADITITQDDNWNAISVNGTAVRESDSKAADITMDGTHPWGEPKLVFTIADEGAISDTRTVIDGKTVGNVDPSVENDSETINENETVIIDVLANDSDTDADDVVTIKSIGEASHGEVFLAEGKVFYTPDLDYSGSDSFDYTVTDGRGGTGQGEISITITGVNNAPVAIADTYTIKQGSADTILDLLSNDTDVEGDTLSITAVSPIPTTAGGFVSIFGDVVSYELPSSTFTGIDTFVYFVEDGVDRDSADVTITVEALNNTPVAAADTITIKEDDDAVQIRVLSNDTDADGDTLSIDTYTNPDHGSVTMLGGFLFYTPDANYSGLDSFSYTVVDEDSAADTETVSITVNAVNDAPVTVVDILNVEEGSDGVTLDVISNDYDREGDIFSLTSVGDALHGTVVIDNGMVIYTPEVVNGVNYTGADEFIYTTTDANGAESTGTVSITVSMANNDPVAVVDNVTVAEDSSRNRISILSNDTDPEGNTIELSSVSGASYGTTEIAGNNILYTPNADYSGKDSFTYRISDGNGGTDKGTANITVTSVNDAPVAVDDVLGSVSSLKTVRLDLDILSNDTDADSNDAISIKSVGDATHGNVTLSGGRVTYKADRGSSGETDSFTYVIEDESGAEDTATATFTISPNTNPNAVNDKVTILEDAVVSEIDIDADTAGVQAVKSNDIDADNDSLTILAINDDASHGIASIQNGKVFYVPDTNYTGEDSFTYKISDGNGGLDVAKVDITITAVNDAPTLVKDKGEVEINTTDNVLDVLDNDSDLDGDSISIESVTDPLHGSATVSGDSLGVTYTPDTDYTGTDSFTYKVTDGSVTSTATVNITVSASNNVPTINDDVATIDEDSKSNKIDVLTNDTDTDGDTLSIASITQGEYGKVSLTKGEIYYTPDDDFFGEDVFTYTATDGNGGISSARVVVTVTGHDDSPTTVNDELDAVKAGSGAAVVDLISNDSDPDGDSISITAVGDAQYGATSLINGTVYFTPASTAGDDIFSYTLEDAGGNTSTGYASIEVAEPNNSPTGVVTITGGAQPYQVLTANNTIADSDGISSDFNYQWYRDDSEIVGETSTTYTISLEDIGSEFAVKVAYTDDLGTAESKTSDATDIVTAIDQPFTFYQQGTIGDDGILTLVLKADVDAIYSRTDITGLTGADLNLNIDWNDFVALDAGSTSKFDIINKASNLIALDSSSTSDADTFDTLTLASTRMSGPLLTLVDTDTTNDASTNIGTTVDLLEISLKPSDPTTKLAIELSGTIIANKGQIEFDQYDSTMSNLTGIETNSDPVGDVTITGTSAVDEVLTASHSLTDADGMNPVSYQWLRDGEEINGETGSTYTVVIADINKDISVKATFFDGGGKEESETSSATTVLQSTDNKPFMFTSELVTAAEASIDLYGADYSVDADETILKLTLEGDITRFNSSYDQSIESIAGAELDINLDWTQFEDINYSFDGTTNSTETYEINKVYTGSLFLGEVVNDNWEFSKIIFSSLNTSKKPVLTLIDDVVTTGRGYTDRPTDVDVATIYLNPLDSVKDVEITFGGDISVNQGDDTFTQLSHSLEVEVSTYDAIVSTEATKGLDNVTINLWNNGSDTTKSIDVDSGEISIDETVDFDEVKIVEDAYDFSSIGISDAIDVLRHIVHLETLSGAKFHAADVDNNGDIGISDAIDILRHIVSLETIDTYDIVDSNGDRITTIDSNMTGDAPQWTIVANGDVDQSGAFVDDYVVNLDIT